MKNRLIVLAMLVMLLTGSLMVAVNISLVASSPISKVDYESAVIKAADRLVALQSTTDYGWDWVVTGLTAHSQNPSAPNLYGVTALGLLDAYQLTGNVTYFNAAKAVADYLVSLGSGTYHYQFDLEFLIKFAEISGDTTYYTFASEVWTWMKANIDRYADGHQVDLYNYYYTRYGESQGAATWATGDWAIAALELGDTIWAKAMTDVIKANYTKMEPDSQGWQYIGWGKALKAFQAVNSTAYATEIADIVSILASRQQADGSFTGWVQDEAYVIMGLVSVGEIGIAENATEWLIEHQGYDSIIGGWKLPDGNEYSEVTSEAGQAVFRVIQAIGTVDLDHYSDGIIDVKTMTISQAIKAAYSGDTIIVHAGIYNEALYIDKSLTVKAAGDGLVVIKGAQMRVTNYGNRQATIFVENAPNVILEGFDIEGEGLGVPSGTKSYAVLYENSTGIIRNCVVSPNTTGDMFSTAIAFWDNSVVTVENSVVKNFGRIGIYSNNATSIIRGNKIIGQIYTLNNQVIYGIEIEDYSGPSVAEITGNKVYNCNNTNPSPLWSSAAILVDGWREWADYYNLALLPSTVAITYNEIYNNYESIELVANEFSYAHYNNFYNNTWGVISAPENWTTNPTYYVFDARYNWWGHETGPYHGTSWTYMGSPYGPHYGLGDNVSDYVLYDPWLTSVFVPPPIHDVTVSQLIATPTMVEIGGTVEINVTVKNLGNVYETFDLTTNYGSIAQVEHIVDLEPGGERTFTYHWDTSGESTCFHPISALAHPVEGETYIYNNFRSVDVAIVSFIPEPATLKVEPSPAKGLREFEVNVTINDLDAYWDMAGFDITLHYNTTMLDVVNVELGPFALNYNLTFQVIKEVNDAEGYIQMAYIWDIAHLLPEERPTPSGSGVLFTITFKVTAEGEDHLSFGDVALATFPNATKWCTETSMPIEHTTEDGIVRTMFPWKEDVNADGKINIQDVVAAATAYASRPGDPNWNPYADLNHDGVITIYDLVSITRIYGITYDP